MNHFNLKPLVQRLCLIVPLIGCCFLPSVSNAQMQRCCMTPDRSLSDKEPDTALRGGTWLQMQERALKRGAQQEAAIRIIRSEVIIRDSMPVVEVLGVRIGDQAISSGDSTAHTTEILGGEIAGEAVLPGLCMPCRNPWSVLMDCSGTTDDSLRSIDPPKNYRQTPPAVDRSSPGSEAVADTMIDDGAGVVMTTDLAPLMPERMLTIGKCGVMVYGYKGEGPAPVEERIIGPIIIDGLLEGVVPEETVEEVSAPQVEAEPGIR